VQPNSTQPGNNQDPAVGQVPFTALPGQSLPPVDPTNLGPSATIPSPEPISTTSINAAQDTIETWVGRVEQTVVLEPNPRKRLTAFAQLKKEYQQNVLGLTGKVEEKPKP